MSAGVWMNCECMYATAKADQSDQDSAPCLEIVMATATG